VLLSVLWLIYIFSGLLRNQVLKFNPFFYFMRINYFVLAVIIALMIDPLIK
jgi:protoheme IX farnesyltransferase